MADTGVSKTIKRDKIPIREDATLLLSRKAGLPTKGGEHKPARDVSWFKERLKTAKNAFLAVLHEAPAVPIPLSGEQETVRDPIAYLISPNLLLPLYDGETYLCSSSEGLSTVSGGIPKGEKIAAISSSYKDNCFLMKGKEAETQLVHGMRYSIQGTQFRMCSFSFDLWREESTNA